MYGNHGCYTFYGIRRCTICGSSNAKMYVSNVRMYLLAQHDSTHAQYVSKLVRVHVYYEKSLHNVACDIVIDHVACESVSCCVIDINNFDIDVCMY